jgi:hypothetical protein
MAKAEKTALWSILFGVGLAVASLALPIAFEVPAYVWRISFSIAVAVCAASGFFIAYLNFVKSHPKEKTRQTRIGIFSAVGVIVVVAAVLASIAIPEPRPAGISEQQLKEAITQPPRVVLSAVEPVWVSKQDDLRFNINFSNQGQRAVRGLGIHFAVGTTPGGLVPDKKYDEIFADLEAKYPPSANSADFMQPGNNRNSTLPGQLDEHSLITPERLKETVKKKGVLFVAIVLNYFDDRTNDVWHTEFCEYWDYNIPEELVEHSLPHYCTSHNGIVAPPGKKQ